MIRAFIYAFAAMLSGLGGALFVLQVGFMPTDPTAENPAEPHQGNQTRRPQLSEAHRPNEDAGSLRQRFDQRRRHPAGLMEWPCKLQRTVEM